MACSASALPVVRLVSQAVVPVSRTSSAMGASVSEPFSTVDVDCLFQELMRVAQSDGDT